MAVKIAAQTTAEPIFAGRRRTLLWVMLVAMLAAGWGLRLYHITDPPFDFHPQRQYFDANHARLMYYTVLKHFTFIPAWKMELASANAGGVSTELPILEALSVAGFLITGRESLALPRGIAATCYVIGGLFLFLLALQLFSPFPAFVALGYYLFMPFAVQSTRTFQPDPVMAALVCAGLYFLYRYSEQQTIRRLLTAAPFVTLALLAKPISIFFTVVPFAALMLGKFFMEVTVHGGPAAPPPHPPRPPLPDERGWLTMKRNRPPKNHNCDSPSHRGEGVGGGEGEARQAHREQLRRFFPISHVAIFCGAVVLGLVWTVWNYATGGGVAQQAGKTFIPALFHEPRWWSAYWQNIWGGALTYWALVSGLLGVLFELIFGILGFFTNRPRTTGWLLIGGWIGYAVYFYCFNYHVQSHVYYNLPMVPIIALSVAALIAACSEWILNRAWARWLAITTWLGYLAYLFFIKLPAMMHNPQMAVPNQQNPVLLLFFAPAAPFVALSLGALSAIIVMQLRTRPKIIRPVVGTIAGIVLAIVLVADVKMIAPMQVHPEYAQLQQILEEIGNRVGHARKAVYLAYAYGDSLRYHGFIGGSFWPTINDIYVDTQVRGLPPKTTAQRLREFIAADYTVFIVDPTMGQEFQELQKDLKTLLDDTYPILDQPPYSPCWIYDLQHPRKPLPER